MGRLATRADHVDVESVRLWPRTGTRATTLPRARVQPGRANAIDAAKPPATARCCRSTARPPPVDENLNAVVRTGAQEANRPTTPADGLIARGHRLAGDKRVVAGQVWCARQDSNPRRSLPTRPSQYHETQPDQELCRASVPSRPSASQRVGMRWLANPLADPSADSHAAGVSPRLAGFRPSALDAAGIDAEHPYLATSNGQ
jgi:hypothetical protein